MSDERLLTGIEDAILDLAPGGRKLDEISRLSGDNDEGGDAVPPWQAAHVWIARSMCLLIDSLEGVEETTFAEGRVGPSRANDPALCATRCAVWGAIGAVSGAGPRA